MFNMSMHVPANCTALRQWHDWQLEWVMNGYAFGYMLGTALLAAVIGLAVTFVLRHQATQATPKPTSTTATETILSETIPADTIPAKMPRAVLDARWVYHRARDLLTFYLYHAAKQHCDISDYASIRRDEVHARWEYIISPQDNYLVLANILVKEAPRKITWEMLCKVRAAFAWRKMVDDWYKALPGTDPQRTNLESHASYTQILRETGRVLDQTFRDMYPQYESVPFAVDGEMKRAREEVGL